MSVLITRELCCSCMFNITLLQVSQKANALILLLYNLAFKIGTLPHPFREALIVLIPKPSKESSYYESYRPTSLICVAVNILAKILDLRLNKVIANFINRDLTGVIPGKPTAINIASNSPIFRFNHVDTRVNGPIDFLILEKFGFGNFFLKWVKLLYRQPLLIITILSNLLLYIWAQDREAFVTFVIYHCYLAIG